MRDEQCVRFLQWALPKLRGRWPGYRKVRRQVCKRVARRLTSLGLPDAAAYQRYLETHPEEWPHLDDLCHIPISRFYRDRAVFDELRRNIVPDMAEAARAQRPARVRAWSAGCGAGEEPYTLNLLWRLSVQPQFPDVELEILATDIDRSQLDRALVACYSTSSLKELPKDWLALAFEKRAGRYSLRPAFRQGVEFRRQDLRREFPDGSFDLILCRNVIFTYCEEGLQREVAAALRERLVPGGVLVLGRHERLPEGAPGFTQPELRVPIYRRE